MDTVKNGLFRQKFDFRFGGMDIYIHSPGGQGQVQHTGGELAHHDLIPVGFFQRRDEQLGFYRPVVNKEGL